MGLTALMLLLQHVSARVLKEHPYRPWPWPGVEWYLGGWSQFDGPEYLKIAASGYFYSPGVRSPVVWFPLYPMTVRAVEVVVGNWLISGVLVAGACGAFAAALLWRWLSVQGMSGRTQTVAFLAAMMYPYAWYLYGVVHSDALFLMLVLGAFLLIERDKFVLAGLVGSLATATRPTGLALIPALVVLAWERSGVLVVPESASQLVRRFRLPVHLVKEKVTAKSFAPLLSCCGVGAYMVFLGVRFGDPLAFKTNQRVYHPENLPLLKRAFFVRWRDFGDAPSYALTITFQACLAALVIWSLPAVARRFGWGYAVFAGVLVAIPMVSTGDFMGTGRYMIAAFPVWAMLGERLAARPRGWTVVATSGVLMVLLSMGFARSWYLT